MFHAAKFCGFLLLYYIPAYSASTGGLIVTAPNRFIPDRPETICITAHNFRNSIPIEAYISLSTIPNDWNKPKTELVKKLLGSANIVINPSQDVQKCVVLTAPSGLDDIYQLEVSVKASQTAADGSIHYAFNRSRAVGYMTHDSNLVVFIQTDKPVYKPGQTVRFRVLAVDTNLKPVTNQLDEVVITTPSSIRVEQWRDITTKTGLGDFSMALSEEPELGTWKIEVKVDGVTETQEFQVEEYVLPKYEVTITPPEYLTLQTPEVPVQVCAKYTYGEPVKGAVYLKTCLERGFNWQYYISRSESESLDLCLQRSSFLEHETGCTYINMTREAVGYHELTEFVYGTRLKHDAYVIEKGTEVRLNASQKSTEFHEHNVTVSLEGRNTFKPGIPFNGKAAVKYQDGRPAPGVNISISISNFQGNTKYVKYYRSDEQGLVYFTLPPVQDDTTSFSISAEAADYPANRYGYGRPSGTLYVQSWYSPSGSYLQFTPNTQVYDCDSNAELDLVYTTNQQAEINLFTVVVGPGDIANQTTQKVTLEMDLRVGAANQSDSSWDKTQADPIWWFPRPYFLRGSSESSGSDAVNKTKKSIPSVAEYYGKIRLSIPVTARMSPQAEVVVYYVARDGEVVSDNLHIETKPCTANKVKMSFSTARGRPGDSVKLSLQASPRSLCAYGVVDKSVFLKGGDNQLKQDTVVNLLSRYRLTEYSGVYERDNYCANKQKRGEDEHELHHSSASDRIDLVGPPLPEMEEEPSVEIVEEPEMVVAESMRIVLTGPTLPTRPTEPTPVPFEQPKMVKQPEAEAGDRAKRSYIMPHYGGISKYIDAKASFARAGLIVMTDLELETRPCEPNRPMFDMYGGRAGPGLRGPAGIDRAMDGEESARVAVSQTKSAALPSLTVRHHFPETWIWDIVTSDADGTAGKSTELPHTITEWIGNALCLNEKTGLGISEPAKVTTFQSFFISATLPYSAVREEIIPIGFTVFNYLDQCIPIQLRFKSSRDYKIQGDTTYTACLCGKDSLTKEFVIQPQRLGTVNLTMAALIVKNDGICPSNLNVNQQLTGVQDSIIKPLLVEPEGAPRDYTISEFICHKTAAGLLSKEYKLPLPSAQKLVPESERAFVSVVGDVMGPALRNLDNLLSMPYGCGEQNMVGFAPNIYVLQYLESTARDDTSVREKAVTHMKSGYQRELTYRHEDGSYSAFGPGPGSVGSIWLTAFVVKCFAQATPYIFVDEALQQQSIKFFKSKQLPNGCFPQVGMVHSKYMQGGLQKDSENTTPLTAYILIAMMEAGLNSSDAHVRRGMECLNLQAVLNDYTRALITYANALYAPNSEKTQQLYRELHSNAILENRDKYWKASNESTKKSKDVTWWYQPVSADVETTAYALLATMILTDDAITDGLPIVRWMSRQRNSQGGFGSTQDTVLGLQALSKYAKLVYSGGQNLKISVRPSRSPLRPLKDFSVNEQNSLVYQEVIVNKLESLTLNVRGDGCFLFQVNVKYNVHTEPSRTEAFPTKVSDFRSSESNNPCKQRTLQVCTRYNGPGLSSNMAVVHVKLVSGWSAETDSLKLLMKDRAVDLKRYDIEKNNDVQLYFDQIRKKEKCFSFEIVKVLSVEGAKPAVVRVYDYYKKEFSSETEYEIFSKFCSDEREQTKADLPDVSRDVFENSLTQQRMPVESRPPFLRLDEPLQLSEPRCPTCYSQASDLAINSTSICGYKKVYKVYWREKATLPITLMADILAKQKMAFGGKHYISYQLPSDCSCVTFFNAKRGDHIAILGNWEKHPDTGEALVLGTENKVIPMNGDSERAFKSASKSC